MLLCLPSFRFFKLPDKSETMGQSGECSEFTGRRCHNAAPQNLGKAESWWWLMVVPPSKCFSPNLPAAGVDTAPASQRCGWDWYLGLWSGLPCTNPKRFSPNLATAGVTAARASQSCTVCCCQVTPAAESSQSTHFCFLCLIAFFCLLTCLLACLIHTRYRRSYSIKSYIF